MSLHRIRRGLDLPIEGAPEQRIDDAPQPSSAALIATDYVGLKPSMKVQVGDAVEIGQVLFEHKKLPGVRFTAPAAGTVTAIERGAKRVLRSVIIRLDRGRESQVSLRSFTGRHPFSSSAAEIRDLLLESGLWTALRERPFGGIARPQSTPSSIFVTACDSEPLAPDLEIVVEGREDDLERGLLALSKLTQGSIYVCRKAGSKIPVPDDESFRTEDFAGPHPSGTVGLHIHRLDPVDRTKMVWHVGLQDVLAIGRLFQTGEIEPQRVISLAGAAVGRPRLLRSRIGASTDDLVDGELSGRPARIISGSVLSGRTASGPIDGFLGRYHQQVSVLEEDDERQFMGWLSPGTDRFSTSRAFLSNLLPRKTFPFSTTTYGDVRSIVPIGKYERVMPLDILPTFLLKAIAVGDVERAEELGVLELEEEDLALCTFVCPSKIDYGRDLRRVLTTLETEG